MAPAAGYALAAPCTPDGCFYVILHTFIYSQPLYPWDAMPLQVCELFNSFGGERKIQRTPTSVKHACCKVPIHDVLCTFLWINRYVYLSSLPS